MSRKFVYITGLHGDEPIPVIALAVIGSEQLVGNPKALSVGKRFINNDLNKSFGIDKSGYEFKRAKEILKLIPKKAIIIDFHTCSAVSPPFVIVVDKKMLSFARKTGLKHVVFMKYIINNGHSLINYRKGISIEVGQHKRYDSFQTMLKVIKNLQLNKIVEQKIYEVYDKITISGGYSNFKKYRDNFYRVLAGENAYNFYGLKAKKII